MTDDRLTQLEQTPFGAALTPRSRIFVSELAKPILLSRGQTLFREGAENQFIYLIVEGQIDLSMTVPGRGAVRILTLGPGDLVAWSSVVGDRCMTCTAQSVEATELLTIPSEPLNERMSHDHEFGFEFMRAIASALAKRLVATRLQLLDLFTAIEPVREKP